MSVAMLNGQIPSNQNDVRSNIFGIAIVNFTQDMIQESDKIMFYSYQLM